MNKIGNRIVFKINIYFIFWQHVMCNKVLSLPNNIYISCGAYSFIDMNIFLTTKFNLLHKWNVNDLLLKIIWIEGSHN